jgi:hypothetical protein
LAHSLLSSSRSEASWWQTLPGGYFSYIILTVAFLISFAFFHLKEQYALPLEWYCQLGPGQTIERRFKIPQPIAQSIASPPPKAQLGSSI